MAKNQHNAGLHYRPLNQLGLSNFNDYIENPIDSRFKFNPPPLKCGKLFGLRKVCDCYYMNPFWRNGEKRILDVYHKVPVLFADL